MSPVNPIHLPVHDPTNHNHNAEPFSRLIVLDQDRTLNLLFGFRDETSVPGCAAAFSVKYCQPRRPYLREQTMKSNLEVTVTGTQLELLKYAVGLISNYYIDKILLAKIVELAEEKHNLEFLGRFLSMKQTSADAFAEILLRELVRLYRIELHVDLLKVLLDSGMDVKATSFPQMSLLETVCVRTRDLSLCQLLLDMGANVNYIDNIYQTALSHACQVGFDAAVELLLKHGADVDIKKLFQSVSSCLCNVSVQQHYYCEAT